MLQAFHGQERLDALNESVSGGSQGMVNLVSLQASNAARDKERNIYLCLELPCRILHTETSLHHHGLAHQNLLEQRIALVSVGQLQLFAVLERVDQFPAVTLCH